MFKLFAVAKTLEKLDQKVPNWIIFDFDGTLFETRESVFAALQLTLEKVGFKASRKIFNKVFGKPIQLEIKMMLPKSKWWLVSRLTQQFKRNCWKFLFDGTKPFKGAQKCLKFLRKKGYRLCIATVKPQTLCKTQLKHFKLLKYFDFIVGSPMKGADLPKEKLLKMAFRKMGKKRDAIFVGDSVMDMHAAKKFRLFAIGAATGVHTKAALKKAGADIVVGNLNGLPEIFRRFK